MLVVATSGVNATWLNQATKKQRIGRMVVPRPLGALLLVAALAVPSEGQDSGNAPAWSKKDAEKIVRNSLGEEQKGVFGFSLLAVGGKAILARWITEPTARALDRLSELDERGRVPRVEGLYRPDYYTIAFSLADLIRSESLLPGLDIPDFAAGDLIGDTEIPDFKADGFGSDADIPIVLQPKDASSRAARLADVRMVPARSVGFIRTQPMLLRFEKADAAGHPLVASHDQEIDLVIRLGDTGRAIRVRFKLKDLPVKSHSEL